MLYWLIMSVFATLGFTILYVIVTIVLSFAAVIGKDAYDQMKQEIKEREEQE